MEDGSHNRITKISEYFPFLSKGQKIRAFFFEALLFFSKAENFFRLKGKIHCSFHRRGRNMINKRILFYFRDMNDGRFFTFCKFPNYLTAVECRFGNF